MGLSALIIVIQLMSSDNGASIFDLIDSVVVLMAIAGNRGD
jgi:hypothetical protein